MTTNLTWTMSGTFKNVALSHKALKKAALTAKAADQAFASLNANYFENSIKYSSDYGAIEKKTIQRLAVDKPPMGPWGNDPVTTPFRRHQRAEVLVYYPRHSPRGDYIENTCNMGEILYTNIRSLLARFFIGIHASPERIKDWRSWCIGAISWVSSSTNRHMPMFDYDGKNVKTQLKKDVKLLQERYALGDAWVYHTKRGFHVYFFTDLVPWDEYWAMLCETKCCKGFRTAAKRHNYGTLRVSAKYTKFDIGLEYILRSQKRYPRRMIRKAHLIQELLKMGQDCETHFASLFPQWAQFREDETEWRGGKEKGRGSLTMPAMPGYKNAGAFRSYRGKRIKKIKPAPKGQYSGTGEVYATAVTDYAVAGSDNAVAVPDNVVYYNTTVATGTTEIATNVVAANDTFGIKIEDG